MSTDVKATGLQSFSSGMLECLYWDNGGTFEAGGDFAQLQGSIEKSGEDERIHQCQ